MDEPFREALREVVALLDERMAKSKAESKSSDDQYYRGRQDELSEISSEVKRIAATACMATL